MRSEARISKLDTMKTVHYKFPPICCRKSICKTTLIAIGILVFMLYVVAPYFDDDTDVIAKVESEVQEAKKLSPDLNRQAPDSVFGAPGGVIVEQDVKVPETPVKEGGVGLHVDTIVQPPVEKQQELCPVIPPNLDKARKVELNPPSLYKMEQYFPNVSPGGRYSPKDCMPRHRVAIVLPYRNQEQHFTIFLYNMHPFLQKQQLDYAIYLVQQDGGEQVNEAALMNIGYLESLKLADYQCFIFQAPNLIPEDERNLYNCPTQPRHMLPEEDAWGGVGALTREHMEQINGFSNRFWGWPGHDLDLPFRVRSCGMHITRYPVSVSKYSQLGDEQENGSSQGHHHYRHQSSSDDFKSDGLNTLKYNVKKLELRPLYTWILAELESAGTTRRK